MQTRSRVRQARHGQPADRRGSHLGFNICGVIVLVFLMLSLIGSRTFFNKRFVMHEVTSSAVESDLLDQVQAGLSQYGISSKLLTKDDTDQIVRTVVNQAFAGQELNLDLSRVTDRLAGQANSQLAQFGVSSSLLPSGATGAVNESINAAVNSRINTPQVKQAINNLQLARTINTAVLSISSFLFVLLLIGAAIRRHLIQSCSWISTIALLISGTLVMAVKGLIPQLVNAEYSSLAVQFAADFQSAALTWLAVLAVIVVILWGIRLLGAGLSFRR
ncbi:hypothetical protein [Limosilactobacillus antri]|uniref:DUF1461 domain-containing protein n=2 Tax=Limosilactobacillus antri DSM 16041 TaxID=525309 RepID=A0ABR5NY16_9LACO|nr:hypothetical protein [Limosilactobacillus antri]KRK56465.1 hypothetical protein FC31_GL001316 [Limosilactobacillus antri DSM 16041]